MSLDETYLLVFVFIEEEIILGRIVRPDFFDALVGHAIFWKVFEILSHLQRSSRALCKVNQFFFGRGPRSVFEIGCEFEGPIHIAYKTISGKKIIAKERKKKNSRGRF